MGVYLVAHRQVFGVDRRKSILNENERVPQLTFNLDSSDIMAAGKWGSAEFDKAPTLAWLQFCLMMADFLELEKVIQL